MRLDQIGYWSEIKLDIIRQYASSYTTILRAQHKAKFRYVYIDAFCGAGLHIAKNTGEFVLGSPLNALNVDPPFQEYYFIDLDEQKVETLRDMIGDRPNVHLRAGDCNHLLLEEVFPRCQRSDYARALCLLDPYGLHLDWQVIRKAGQLGTVEIFLNFPVMDMNILWREPEKASKKQVERMNAFWGDESWRESAYSTDRNLFGFEEKESNEAVARAFQERLRVDAGFAYVPDPIPMRNSTGAIVYYLFFAAQKRVAEKIVKYIFDKYRDRGMQ